MGICDVPLISLVCDTVGEAAATLISAPFNWLASVLGEAAGWMFETLWTVLDTSTLVDVTSPGYVSVYNILFGVAVFIVLLFFCIQLITGVLHRDPQALSKAALGVAKSVLGSFLVISLTAALLEVTDQLSVGIVQAAGTTMEEMGGRLAALMLGLAALAVPAPGVAVIVTIFLAGLAISGTALVWFTLLIRKTLLLVAIVMAPIALSGFSMQATKGWFGKWAAFVLALIVSKLVIVVVFLVATAQVSAPIDFDLASISEPIAGIVLMFVAAFAPYMAYKFISFAGIDMYQAISAEQDTKSALNRPIPLPSPAAPEGASLLSRGASSGRSGQGAVGAPSPSPSSPPSPGAGASASAGAAATTAAAASGPRVAKTVASTAEEHSDASQQSFAAPSPDPTRSQPAPASPPPDSSATPRQANPGPPK